MLEETLALLPACGLASEWQDADTLFDSGNSVTNRLLTPLLRRYQEIGCLFDGGLKPQAQRYLEFSGHQPVSDAQGKYHCRGGKDVLW